MTFLANYKCFSEEILTFEPYEAQPLGPQESVAVGYWDKKDAIPTINSDLLWIKCTLRSNISGHDDVEIECMVDTGSEVVTCKKEIVEELGLEFLRYVGSKGIHAVAEKPLHRGILILGNKELEVEVSQSLSDETPQ